MGALQEGKRAVECPRHLLQHVHPVFHGGRKDEVGSHALVVREGAGAELTRVAAQAAQLSRRGWVHLRAVPSTDPRAGDLEAAVFRTGRRCQRRPQQVLGQRRPANVGGAHHEDPERSPRLFRCPVRMQAVDHGMKVVRNPIHSETIARITVAAVTTTPRTSTGTMPGEGIGWDLRMAWSTARLCR